MLASSKPVQSCVRECRIVLNDYCLIFDKVAVMSWLNVCRVQVCQLSDSSRIFKRLRWWCHYAALAASTTAQLWCPKHFFRMSFTFLHCLCDSRDNNILRQKHQHTCHRKLLEGLISLQSLSGFKQHIRCRSEDIPLSVTVLEVTLSGLGGW